MERFSLKDKIKKNSFKIVPKKKSKNEKVRLISMLCCFVEMQIKSASSVLSLCGNQILLDARSNLL